MFVHDGDILQFGVHRREHGNVAELLAKQRAQILSELRLAVSHKEMPKEEDELVLCASRRHLRGEVLVARLVANLDIIELSRLVACRR
jgi:hypothetical protein